jgi:hypothetical protein
MVKKSKTKEVKVEFTITVDEDRALSAIMDKNVSLSSLLHEAVYGNLPFWATLESLSVTPNAAPPKVKLEWEE